MIDHQLTDWLTDRCFFCLISWAAWSLTARALSSTVKLLKWRAQQTALEPFDLSARRLTCCGNLWKIEREMRSKDSTTCIQNWQQQQDRGERKNLEWARKMQRKRERTTKRDNRRQFQWGAERERPRERVKKRRSREMILIAPWGS